MVEIVYGEFIQVKSEAEKYFECYRFSKIRCYLNILTRIQLIQLAYPFYIEATRTYANDAWIKRNLCGVNTLHNRIVYSTINELMW